MKKFFLTLLATLSFVFSMAQDHDRRVVIIMLDGLRWQELFNGADTAYVNISDDPDWDAERAPYAMQGAYVKPAWRCTR